MKDNDKTKSHHKIEGWKLVSKTKEEDLESTFEIYKGSDTETRIVKVNKDECGECTKCFVTGTETIYRIYIRQYD